MNARNARTAVGIAAALIGTLWVLPAPVLAAPATTSTDASPGPTAPRETVRQTRLTFEVADCEGCEIQLTQALRNAPGQVRVWTSQTRTVQGGRVRFRPATRRTWGLSVAVRAPWEGHTGYVTTVAWRYGNKAVGDPVTVEEAVTKNRASACWEGTRRRELSVPLVVEEVEVAGVHERVPGSIAFVPVTQSWLRPMREVWDGVLGSQDVNICR